MSISSFNIRVYGLLISKRAVLVTHENRGGMLMYKFPGGGLEKGEGLADCVKREFDEELAIEIEVREHFYVNSFLQVSRFNPADQLMSHYYLVDTERPDEIEVQELDAQMKAGEQTFEWVLLNEIDVEKFTFPIDKVVAEKLKLI